MNSVDLHSVHLCLGSNLGDRVWALRHAIEAITMLPGTCISRCSSIYETEPWGECEQGMFLNCVVELSHGRDPEPLLADIKNIERGMGRIGNHRNGPRLIDIDILLYGSCIIHLENLHIPHPLLPSRRFVLLPLRELAGDAIHPELGMSIDELTNRCTDRGGVWKTDIVFPWMLTAETSFEEHELHGTRSTLYRF